MTLIAKKPKPPTPKPLPVGRSLRARVAHRRRRRPWITWFTPIELEPPPPASQPPPGAQLQGHPARRWRLWVQIETRPGRALPPIVPPKPLPPGRQLLARRRPPPYRKRDYTSSYTCERVR
jgi:hypothetical protein